MHNRDTSRVVGSFFRLGELSKNVGHHDWPTMRNFKITLANALKQSQKMKFGPENK